MNTDALTKAIQDGNLKEAESLIKADTKVTIDHGFFAIYGNSEEMCKLIRKYLGEKPKLEEPKTIDDLFRKTLIDRIYDGK